MKRTSVLHRPPPPGEAHLDSPRSGVPSAPSPSGGGWGWGRSESASGSGIAPNTLPLPTALPPAPSRREGEKAER